MISYQNNKRKYHTKGQVCFYTIAENVSRQCLPGGTWFYCPGPNISLGVGWTNWSHCWSASTEKIMADLNQKAICPSDENQDNSAEVSNCCLLSVSFFSLLIK